MPPPNQPSFSPQDYEIISRKELYTGFFNVVQYQFRIRLFEGGFSHLITRLVTEPQKAVCLLPYDPKTDNVILIEQFRIGAYPTQPQNPWLLEIIAGICEPNEQPSQVGIREAKEEAGCEILALQPICDFFSSPGHSSEYVRLFCGRFSVETSGKVTAHIHGLKEENENIRAMIISLEEACRLVETGKINTPPAIISLQWLQLNQQRLKKLWQIK